MSIIAIDVTCIPKIKKGDCVIPDPTWTQEDWLKFYHIHNECPETLAAFISSKDQKRFCGCILSESEVRHFLEMFPGLKIRARSQSTFGTADLKPKFICQGYTVNLTTGQLIKANMGTELRYSFTFEKKPAQRT